jgi:hypothetical protein
VRELRRDRRDWPGVRFCLLGPILIGFRPGGISAQNARQTPKRRVRLSLPVDPVAGAARGRPGTASIAVRGVSPRSRRAIQPLSADVTCSFNLSRLRDRSGRVSGQGRGRAVRSEDHRPKLKVSVVAGPRNQFPAPGDQWGTAKRNRVDPPVARGPHLEKPGDPCATVLCLTYLKVRWNGRIESRCEGRRISGYLCSRATCSARGDRRGGRARN